MKYILFFLFFLQTSFGLAQFENSSCQDFALPENLTKLQETSVAYSVDQSTNQVKLTPKYKRLYVFAEGKLLEELSGDDFVQYHTKYSYSNGKIIGKLAGTDRVDKLSNNVQRELVQSTYSYSKNGNSEEINIKKEKPGEENKGYQSLFEESYKNYYNNQGELVKQERYLGGRINNESIFSKDSIFSKNWTTLVEKTEYLKNDLVVKSVLNYFENGKKVYEISEFEYDEQGNVITQIDYGKRKSKNIAGLTEGINYTYFDYLYKEGFWIIQVQYFKSKANKGEIWIKELAVRALQVGEQVIELKSNDEALSFIEQLKQELIIKVRFVMPWKNGQKSIS
ncbi:MAG: hypothetical protein R2772_05165 [Chitinophagales bacterium]